MIVPDIKKLRSDTPGTERFIHMNNAGAALMTKPVIAAIKDHIDLEAKTGGYEAATMKKEEVAGFYSLMARLLNTNPAQIAFAGSATQAYNTALSSIPFKAGDYLLTTNEDYVSNQLAFLQLQKFSGVNMIRVADLAEGGYDPEDLERKVKKYRPRLVAITHVPTSSGLVQDVEAAGKICQKYDCFYLLDACQSVGQLAIDVKQLHCDFLTGTFRKFLRGPRGTGFLYVSKKVLNSNLEPRFLDLHSANWDAPSEYSLKEDAKRFETWERSHALVLGARAAAEYALNLGALWIQDRVISLSDQLREQLSGIKGLQLLSRGEKQCAILTMNILNHSNPQRFHQKMIKQGVNCSITYQSSALIDYRARKVEWALRLSPHYYNTEEEISRVALIVEQLVNT